MAESGYDYKPSSIQSQKQVKAKLQGFPATASQHENVIPERPSVNVNIMRLETNVPKSGDQSVDGSAMNSSQGARGFSRSKMKAQGSTTVYPDATSLDSIESARRQSSAEMIVQPSVESRKGKAHKQSNSLNISRDGTAQSDSIFQIMPVPDVVRFSGTMGKQMSATMMNDGRYKNWDIRRQIENQKAFESKYEHEKIYNKTLCHGTVFQSYQQSMKNRGSVAG